MATNDGTFGTPNSANRHQFIANYKGPLNPLKMLGANSMQLLATHQDPNATLGLTGSAQAIIFDTSVVPNRVSGEASFFTSDGKDILFCTFAGVAPEPKPSESFQRAFVHVVFTGGTGKFTHATGTGSVEAELHPNQGFSQGRIEANVILPAQ